MVLASILLVGLIRLVPGDVPERATIAMPGVLATAEATPPAWDHAARPNPRRGSRRAILDCEGLEEEDSSDDPSSESALGTLSWRIVEPSADPLARRGHGPVISRSASPTLRLRC